MARNPASSGSGAATATPATFSMTEEIICGGWWSWGAGWCGGRGGGGGAGIGALDGLDSPAGRACVGCLRSRAARIVLLE